MPFLRRCFQLAAVALALVLPSAANAGTWGPPNNVSYAHTFIGPLTLERSNGGMLATWGWRDGLGDDGRDGRSFTINPGADVFGPEKEAPTSLLTLRPFGTTGLLGLTQGQLPGGRHTGLFPFEVAAFTGDTSGGFAPPHVVARVPTAYQPQLDVAPDGRAIVAYVENSQRRRIVRVAIRDTRGRWTAPSVLVGRGRTDVLATAIGARGDMVVALAREGRLLARVRRPGRGWGSLMELTKATGPTQWQIRAAIDLRGRVELVWRRHQFNRGGVAGRRAIEAAYMPVGRSRFTSVQTVEADGASPPSEILDTPDGFAVAYTEDGPNGGAIPRVRNATPRFGEAFDAAPATGGLRDARLAWSPVFGTFATWVVPRSGGDSDGQGMGALLAMRAAAFFAPEAITPSENVHEIAPGFDRDTGRPIAVWSARPQGTGPSVPVSSIRTVVRTARRQDGA